jgi:hypothetical protein
MASPTQRAEQLFSSAKRKMQNTVAEAYGEGRIAGELREGLIDMIDGLSHLAAGVRATYMFLEQMQKSIDQLRQQGRSVR